MGHGLCWLPLFCLLSPVSSLISPMKGTNGEPDINSIITHMTLMEQTVGELNSLKTKFAVLENNFATSQNQIETLSSKLATCSTDIAQLKARDCCDANKDIIRSLTSMDKNLQNQVTSLSKALAASTNAQSSTHGMPEFVMIDGWVLAFRIQPNNGISAYDTYMNDAIYHDNPRLPWLDPACQSLQATHACPLHFKSKIIPLWETADIKQVKVQIFKHNQIRQEILFDGVGTTKTSWFSRKNVLNSTWTDLKTAPDNFFSIDGHAELHRRFFINEVYGACDTGGDAGWLIVLDGPALGPCYYDIGTTFPRLFYNKLSTAQHMGASSLNDFEFGDLMVILVKLGDM